MRVRIFLALALLPVGVATGRAQSLNEAFDDITTLPAAGWVIQNNSSPAGALGWFQGNPAVFPAQAGATDAYIGVNFNSTSGGDGTISNWLVTPAFTLASGDTLTFYTRTVDTPTFPDRLQVRMSLAGSGTNVGTTATDVGSFTKLLLDINPTYLVTGYPNVWTQYTVTITGVPTPTQGRLAFRYFVEHGGPDGLNSDYIGIDTVGYTPAVLQGANPLGVDTAGNSVLEPGETVALAPSWRNAGSVAITTLTGTLSGFTGPAGGTYTITDGTATYDTPIAPGAQASCTTGGDCYEVTVSGTRPATHWDATITETLAGDVTQTINYTLHVGNSFTDVPNSSPFYRFIETLLHNGITGGCGPDTYCPANPVTREQMAPFVLLSKEGTGYSPAACGTTPMFGDVPASSPFCKWIEELANRGVVSGCGGGNYCPTAQVTREQMPVFVLRTLDPALNPPACTTPMFGDVPASNPFCKWIEELARRGVVTGCGNNNYCPGSPVTREQMGVFLSSTFALKLYLP